MPATPAKLSTMPSLPARIIAYFFVGILCAAGPVYVLIAAGTGLERDALSVPASLLRASSDVAPSVPHRPTDKSRRPCLRLPRRTAPSFTITSNIAEAPVLPGVLAIASCSLPARPSRERRTFRYFFLQLWMPQVIVGIVGGAFSAMPFLIFVRRRRSATVAAACHPLKSAHSPAGERYRYHGTTPSLVDQRALDQPAAERDGFIDAAGESPSVAAEVRKLLSGDQQAGSFLQHPGRNNVAPLPRRRRPPYRRNLRQ